MFDMILLFFYCDWVTAPPLRVLAKFLGQRGTRLTSDGVPFCLYSFSVLLHNFAIGSLVLFT